MATEDFRNEDALRTEIIQLNKKLNFYKLTCQDYFNKIVVDDCHSSNVIEGNTLTKMETEALLNRGSIDKIHSEEEQDIINYSNARHLILSWYKQKNKFLTIDKIVQLHSLLIQNPLISGYIRQRPGLDEVGISGRSGIKLTAASQVYTELNDALSIYNSHLDINMQLKETLEETQARLLEVIIDFKYDYVCIHPFLDGNGRTSRLLLNYLLMVNDFRPIYINPEDFGKAYKNAIYKSQQTNDLSYFRTFMYQEIINNYTSYLEDAKAKGGVTQW